MTPRRTREQINTLIEYLVEVGLSDDQQFAFERGNATVEVTFENASYVTEALSGQPYENIYGLFKKQRVFNVRLLDGALVQMQYLFSGSNITKHRLAFLPSPHLVQYEREPTLYDMEHTFAEIVGRRVIAIPMRFDFDADDLRHTELNHPKSHLTLGEYSQCRIPVSSPLTPHCFIEFLLKHFYRTRSREFTTTIPHLAGTFSRCITTQEQNTVHIALP